MVDRVKLKAHAREALRKKMRPGGGREKGFEFERVMCRRFSVWVSHGKRTDIYWRTRASGGTATLAKKRGQKAPTNSAGDMCCMDEIGKMLLDWITVEFKHVAELGIGALPYATGVNPPILQFWRQAVDQCSDQKTAWLVMRQTGRPVLLGMHPYVLKWFETTFNEDQRAGKFPAALIYPARSLAVVELEPFLKAIAPEDLEKIWPRR